MNRTVNLSLQDSLLAQIDELAERESRSRSELLREAARLYIERKQRWDEVFALGDEVRRRRRITPKTVADEIAAHRKGR